MFPQHREVLSQGNGKVSACCDAPRRPEGSLNQRSGDDLRGISDAGESPVESGVGESQGAVVETKRRPNFRSPNTPPELCRTGLNLQDFSYVD